MLVTDEEAISLSEQSLTAVGEACEQLLLDTDTLKKELGTAEFRRKDLCEYLGIGESTLTGWYQAGRLPRMAAEAYVLFKAVKALGSQIGRLRSEVARANDVKVIELNGKFALLGFVKRDDGELVGKIIAENIESYEAGRSLAEGISESLKQKLERAAATAFDQYDEDDASTHYWREQSESLDESRALLTDYTEWRKQYKPTLAELA